MIWSSRVIGAMFDMTGPDPDGYTPGTRGTGGTRLARAAYITFLLPSLFNNLGLIEQTVSLYRNTSCSTIGYKF